MLSKLLRKLHTVFTTQIVTSQTDRLLTDQFRFRNANLAKSNEPLILLNCMDQRFNYLLFGELITALRVMMPLRVEGYISSSLIEGAYRSFRRYLSSRLDANLLVDARTRRLYSAFCDGIAWRALAWHFPWQEARFFHSAWRAWRNLQSKDDLFKLWIGELWVGDLVVDSYLRFQPSPEVKLRDWGLFFILWQAWRDVASAEQYFRRKRPQLFLTCYTTYIQHGIAVRSAVRHGVKVLAFGNYQEFGTWVTPDHLCHTKRDHFYRQEFDSLDDQSARLELADRYLTARFAGAVDTATAYMKTSAYAAVDANVPDVNGAAIIFLHDFFDSPNIHRNMIFVDFWEWLEFTIKTLSDEGQDFFIKPHPNQLPQSAEVVEEFIRRYPAVRIVPAKVTNTQLVAAGMTCGISVYGTVVSELAYMGVPSICCSDHPAMSFDYALTARTRKEYASLLRGIPDLVCDKTEMKRQACAFEYMHNHHLDADDIVLRDEFVRAWNSVTDLSSASDAKYSDYISTMSLLTASPGFKRFVCGLRSEIDFEPSTNERNSKRNLACSKILRS